mmetsp:Transcript_3339/g.10461  ORF Transcript_3339/g.10461 Transcript_3339/m.10461 type:complete len:968 (-) Transcript_3339:97-3000(-)
MSFDDEPTLKGATTADEKPSCLRRAADGVERGISEGTARVARFVTKRPWTTIVLAVICSLCLATGFLRLENEDQPEELYVPSGSRAQRDKHWVDNRFGDTDDVSTLLLDRKAGANLLTKESLLEVFDVYDKVMSISNGAKRGYDERSCAKAYWDLAEPCQKSGVLAFWNWDRAALEADDDVLATLNAPARDCCSPRGRETNLEDVASKLTRDESGRIVAAGALSLDFYLRARNHDKTGSDPHNRRLEKKFDRLRRQGGWVYFRKPIPLTREGQIQNVSGAFDRDQLLVNFAFVIIFLYAFWALHDRKDPYLSRGWLGVAAALVVLLAVGAGFGLALWFGTVFSATASIAIFLVLGIGLDDAFVICGAESNHRGDFARDAAAVAAGADVAEVASARIVRAMASAGPSIFVTSITDFCAFIAGSFTTIPAIEAFCVFCATAVLTDYLLQTTLFVAIMTFDMRRKLRRGANELGGVEPRCYTCSKDALGDPEVVTDRPSNFFGGRYARVLLSVPGMAFVLLSTAGLAVMGAVGASRVTAEFDYEWFLVPGWYLDAYNFQERHFRNSLFYPIGVYTGKADYFEATPKMQELLDDYRKQGYVVDSSLDDNWFDAHAVWAAPDPPTDSDAYLVSVAEFLESPEGIGYQEKVVFNDDVTAIKATKINALWKFNGKATSVKIMRRMIRSRKLGRRVGGGLNWRFYDRVFVFAEGIKVVLRESVFSMSLACVTVGFVLLLLLGDVIASLLVGTMVVCVCLITYGSIYWRGGGGENFDGLRVDFWVCRVGLLRSGAFRGRRVISTASRRAAERSASSWGKFSRADASTPRYHDYLNNVSGFFVIIAVGLASDASAHYCHAFLESSKPTSRERAVEALDLLGPSIFLGGTSTLFGIGLTGLSITYVFQTFFKYLVTILVLSLWFGLVVMPVACALLAPRARHKPSVVKAPEEPIAAGLKEGEPVSVAGGPVASDAPSH